MASNLGLLLASCFMLKHCSRQGSGDHIEYRRLDMSITLKKGREIIQYLRCNTCMSLTQSDSQLLQKTIPLHLFYRINTSTLCIYWEKSKEEKNNQEITTGLIFTVLSLEGSSSRDCGKMVAVSSFRPLLLCLPDYPGSTVLCSVVLLLQKVVKLGINATFVLVSWLKPS